MVEDVLPLPLQLPPARTGGLSCEGQSAETEVVCVSMGLLHSAHIEHGLEFGPNSVRDAKREMMERDHGGSAACITWNLFRCEGNIQA